MILGGVCALKRNLLWVKDLYNLIECRQDRILERRRRVKKAVVMPPEGRQLMGIFPSIHLLANPAKLKFLFIFPFDGIHHEIASLKVKCTLVC